MVNCSGFGPGVDAIESSTRDAAHALDSAECSAWASFQTRIGMTTYFC